MDTTPLRGSSSFRLLLLSRTISLFGAQATIIALLVQTKDLTNSALAVGLLGAVEVPAVVIFGLCGGQLADRLDRRGLALATEMGLGVVALGLMLNSLSGDPFVWSLYAAAAITAALVALQRPGLDATVPRIVEREQLTAASALLALSSSTSFLLGSAVGGLVVAELGPDAAYALDVGTYLASGLCFLALRPLPPALTSESDPQDTGWREILSGIRYIGGRQDLIGSYLVDLAAMGFAFPEGLYPFMASTLHARWALGLMFSAGAVGAAVAALTSRWTARVRRHGLGIALAGIAWASAIAAFGLAPDVATALAALLAAGAADLFSGIFRDTLWNQTVPDHLRGRVAGAEVISYSLGPAIGQIRAGAVASLTSTRFSLWSGGALCAISIGVTCRKLPKFTSSQTPPHPATD